MTKADLEGLARVADALEHVDYFHIMGAPQDVPAEVCDHCGETTLQPAVVERLQETVWQSRTPLRLIETPVYEFA